MNQERSSFMSKFIPVLISFVLGAAFGLVVLGWILWPVKWTNSSPAALDAHNRQSYLRAAIDSYSLNQDAELAKERYAALGEFSDSTLAAVNSNPKDQDSEQIRAFAGIVGAEAVLQVPPGMPTPAGAPVSPAETAETSISVTEAVAPSVEEGQEPAVSEGGSTGVLVLLRRYLLPVALVLAALLVILLLLVIRSSRRRSRQADQIQNTGIPPIAERTYPESPDTLTPPDDWITAAPGYGPVDEIKEAPTPTSTPTSPELAEIPDWLQETPTQGTAEDIVETPAITDKLPDWLQETPTQGTAEDIVETPAITDELPDWLQETPTKATAEAIVENPVITDELPDWLQEPPTEAAPEARVETPAVSEELPEWLQPAPVEETAEAVVEAPAAPAEFPEWLQEQAPVAAAPVELPIVEETPEQTHAKFGRDLASLPAMEPGFAARLRAAGISAPLLLLRKGATDNARRQLAERAGIDVNELTTWVHLCDMLRVRGINAEHALLLDGVDVHSVADLASSDPAALHPRLVTANAEYNLFDQPPSLTQVSDWVKQAQKLPQAVS